ncbi:hypothetical protein GIB67_007416, partial [Kingdonia uniflora]
MDPGLRLFGRGKLNIPRIIHSLRVSRKQRMVVLLSFDLWYFFHFRLEDDIKHWIKFPSFSTPL